MKDIRLNTEILDKEITMNVDASHSEDDSSVTVNMKCSLEFLQDVVKFGCPSMFGKAFLKAVDNSLREKCNAQNHDDVKDRISSMHMDVISTLQFDEGITWKKLNDSEAFCNYICDCLIRDGNIVDYRNEFSSFVAYQPRVLQTFVKYDESSEFVVFETSLVLV